LLLIVLVVLIAVGLVFTAMANFGWLIAIAGLGVAIAAYRSPGVRAWALWKRFPFLAAAGSPAWFAAILAGYLVLAPAGIWGVAWASSTAAPASTTGNSSASTHTPASNNESTPKQSTSAPESPSPDAESEASSVQVATTTALPAPLAAPTCGDPHAHVYNPGRLHLLAACVTVNGTVDIIRAEKDGDVHILLRLDAGQDKYINAKNVSTENGDLVLEPVCVRAVTQLDAVSACAGYVNPLPIPAVGSHVAVTGAWVLDVDHGWMEIHPVASFNAVGAAPPASTPTPTAAPTAAPPPPPPAVVTVTFLNAPITVPHGQTAHLQVKTTGNTSCSIVVTYKSGPSTAAGLSPMTSDGTGNVGWSWIVGARTTLGSWPITVTCAGVSAQTTITVT
jgi:hypothetical protein